MRDTLRYSDENGYAAKGVERDNLWAVETPQGFHYCHLKSAHEQFSTGTDYTDDTKIISELGIPTKFILSTGSNLKITWPDDFLLAETILLSRKA